MADDGGDIQDFDNGTKSARTKLNKLKDRVNNHEKTIKKLSKFGPYIIVICVDDTPQLLEIMARKTDASDT